MNVVELFARQRGLSRQCVLALVFAILPPWVLAAIRRRAVGLGRLVRPTDLATVFFFGVGLPHQCAATVSALLNELVEPLSDRNAGSTRRVVGVSRASGRRPLRFHGPPDFIARKATSGGTRKSPCFEPRPTQKIQGRDP